MGQLNPFLAMGKSFVLTSNAVASTNTSFAIVLATAGLNPGQNPQQLRAINTGTAMIWGSFSGLFAATAVIPTAGTIDMGTPQPVEWFTPNVEVTLSIPGNIGTMQPAGTGIGFWLNLISTGTAQALQLQFGEGT